MEQDWQNGLHRIKDRGSYLLGSEKWSDCRFLVGSPPNQESINAHKIILAMASPVFERMFYGNMPVDNSPIQIPDVQPAAFRAMLEYIYSDRITIASFDKACELCYVAKKYLLPFVVEQCTQFLWADLSPTNACRAYEFAKLFDEPHLMKSSMDIIISSTSEVLADPNFLDIETTTFLSILDQDKLNISSELDIFNALVRYVDERNLLYVSDALDIQPCNRVCFHNVGTVNEIKLEPDVLKEQSCLDIPQNNVPNFNLPLSCPMDEVCLVESEDMAGKGQIRKIGKGRNVLTEQQRATEHDFIRQAVKKIRFLTLTPQQFAEGPARSRLLHQHEALSILIKISSPSLDDKTMPAGFCISRISRNSHETRNDLPLCHANALSEKNVNYYMDTVLAPTVDKGDNDLQSNNGTDSDIFINDTRRLYCVHTNSQQFDYRNMNVTDCGLTFQVDTNIWVLGVQVPTQVLCGELMNTSGFSDRYMEILYAHIQDMQGSRLSYTHCTSRVGYNAFLEISFDRPVYIHRNQIYKVFVVFNKVGWYPMFSCLTDVVCDRVKFMFNVGNPAESVRDGLIRAIVFSTPQESRYN